MHPPRHLPSVLLTGAMMASTTLAPAQHGAAQYEVLPNALAIRISPPPHPGIPQEQSVLGGPGENGGMMCLDGPTFVATEGWDWIPAERDRDSGLWQDVRLVPSGQVKVGDAQAVTILPRLQTPGLLHQAERRVFGRDRHTLAANARVV
jgi:hypothetical protein